MLIFNGAVSGVGISREGKYYPNTRNPEKPCIIAHVLRELPRDELPRTYHGFRVVREKMEQTAMASAA